MKPSLKIICGILACLLAGLACTALAPSDIQDLGLPTLEPTTAPSPEPGDLEAPTLAPSPAGPQTFTGEAAKNDFASDGAICLVYQPVTLVVQGDGTAELSTTGADIIDHANCTTGTTNETWYINGVVDAAAQVVNFQTCNFGRFTAAGAVSYAGGQLSGQVSCTNKDGVKFIALVIGQ
jgi:hypothetical protein